MNYLQISLTSKCNRKCVHCPMAQWLNTDDKKYHLTNDVLIPWIEKNIEPNHWLIELTGGEPTLYDGISELLDWLSQKGYRVQIRTNGIIPVAYRQGLTRVVAFHDLEHPPEVFDWILIVDKLQSQEKIAYCIKHNFKYKVIGYNKDNPDNAQHHFDQCAFIEPSCHQVICPSAKVKPDIKEVDGKLVDVTRLEYSALSTMKCCRECKAAVDAWRFL